MTCLVCNKKQGNCFNCLYKRSKISNNKETVWERRESKCKEIGGMRDESKGKEIN